MNIPLLDVADLTVRFRADGGRELAAVSDVSFRVAPGERVGIVGESGSGKSQILMAIMGLLAGNGRAAGSVRFRGEEMLGAPRARLDALRGSAVAIVFQDPMTALNPYMRVETQLTEVLVRHQGLGGAEARAGALAMLDRVRIPEARRRIRLYPHEFSGGMRQRVMIAMALLCRPALLFADEPTTALDVTVEAQILELIAELSREAGTATVIVTHDFGVVAELCDRVIVLYGGRVMEEGPVEAVFDQPQHPYTRALLASMPRIDADLGAPLRAIPGQPPSALRLPPGCPFAPRCALAEPACAAAVPPLQRRAARAVACIRAAP